MFQIKNLTRPSAAVAAIAMLAASAGAHGGRRFDIQIINDTIWAQGYISGANPNDDGGGLIRPYHNAIHGHWSDNPAPGVQAASATLPGFDLFEGGALTGESLEITLTGASKWVAPPVMPDATTVVDLVALDAGEEIFVGYDGEFVSTETPGTLTLFDVVSAGGHTDIDLTYDIGARPEGVLYVLDFALSTSADGVATSETVHVILSPDGDTMAERLHHAALHLEEHLGTVVPSPAVLTPVALGGVFAGVRRR